MLDLTLETPIFNFEYLTRLRDGDSATERHFVSHFSNLIRLTLRYRLRSTEMMEDVRQETFLRVIRFLRAGNSLDRPERLDAYVHSVCVNVMLEQLRANARHPQVPKDGRRFIDVRADPEREAEVLETATLVHEILGALPEKDREILRLVFLEEKDKGAACRQFKVGRDYLRVLVHRAKMRFRAAMRGRKG